MEAIDEDPINADDFIDSFSIDISSIQPIRTTLIISTPDGILGGAYGHGRLGLTIRIVCTENYYGNRCQFLDVVDQCLTENITCNSRGTCVDGILSYTCNCNPGYTGTDCELVDYCGGVICNNNGICQNVNNTYTCLCAAGFTGSDCRLTDYCLGVNCSDRGSCQNEDSSYTCDCNPGYTGVLCEDIDDCIGVNCSGNGQCVDGVSNFTCLCEFGFTGDLCSVVVQGKDNVFIGYTL